MEIEKLIEQLQKSADFEDYPVVASFAAIIEKKYLREAATALEQLQAENDRLQAELEKAEAVRKKQADILYELRGQKYEQTTAIDQLRAENDRLRRERDAAVEDLNAIIGDIEEIRRGYGVDNGDADSAFADAEDVLDEAATALEHLQWAWDDYRCEHDISDIVTDWMPLPSPPKEE